MLNMCGLVCEHALQPLGKEDSYALGPPAVSTTHAEVYEEDLLVEAAAEEAEAAAAVAAAAMTKEQRRAMIAARMERKQVSGVARRAET